MGVYVYCVVSRDQPEPRDVVGIDGAEVRSMESAGLRFWTSPMPQAPGASLDRVRAHNAVVDAAMRDATPLPMRFGHWFASTEEMEEVLGPRRAQLERSLDRVADAVEFGVRVLEPGRGDPEPPDRSSGRAYLEALARREERAEAARRRGAAVAAEMQAALGSTIRAQAVRPGGPNTLITIAHLVARHDTGAYRGRMDTFPARHPGLTFAVSGPWPPYGFVDDSS